MRSALCSGLGLALALALVLALGAVLPQPAGVTAAPLPQRTRQPTSNTATPRITLPTDTPAATASPTATGRGPTAVPTGGAAVTDSPLATPPPAGGSPAPGGPGQSGGTGSGSGRLPADPGAVVTPGPLEGGTGPPGIGPPALPGGEGSAGGVGVPPGGATDGGEGASAGGDGLLAVPGSGEADAASLDGVPEDVGPSGLVRVPVPDPRLRALWAAGGSPRQGQGLAARFTEGRPGPWGFSLFYVLLVGVFGFVVFRLWGALGGLEGRDADMPFPEDRGPDTLQRGDLGPTDPAKPAPRQIDSPERDA